MSEDPGFLLVQAGLVTDDQLLTAREARAQKGGTLGEHLVLAGFVDDDTLADFYSGKFVIPRITVDDLARIPADVLSRIPADMAAEFRVIPVATDRELNLTLAMSDPADRHVVDEVAFFTGTYVVRAVATQLQIAWCLARYYGVMTPLARARLVGNGVRAQARAAVPAAAALVPPGTPSEMEEEETGPARMPLQRRKQVRRGTGTGELAPRSGTLEVAPPAPEPERLPAVVVDEDEMTGQTTYPGADALEEDSDLVRAGGAGDGKTEETENVFGDEDTTQRRPRTDEPILLDRPTGRGMAADSAASHRPNGSGEILLLDQVKNRRRPTSPGTEPGLGHFGSVDSRPKASHDTESRGSARVDDEGENEAVRRQSKADRRGRRSRGHAIPDTGGVSDETAEPMGQRAAAASARAPAADPGPAMAVGEALAEGGGDVGEGGDSGEAITDPGEAITTPMRDPSRPRTAVTGPDDWNVDAGWDLDAWGPAGSTIPPEYLGAGPDSDEDQDALDLADGSARIVDAAAVAAAAASATAALAAQRGADPTSPAGSAEEDSATGSDPAALAAELERSSNRLLETLRALERAPGRDEVVDLLLDHMGGSLRRRAFFAVKAGVLFSFRQQGAARPGIGVAELALDKPSTFGEVALNRIPYRGTLSPAAVEFVERALGSPGKGDAVVVPVAVRGRAVGLLYGDGVTARLFEEHQMVLGRAAGQALERILATRLPKT